MPYRETRYDIWRRFIAAHDDGLWSVAEIALLRGKSEDFIYAAFREGAITAATVLNPQLAKRGTFATKDEVRRFLNADWSMRGSPAKKEAA